MHTKGGGPLGCFSVYLNGLLLSAMANGVWRLGRLACDAAKWGDGVSGG